VSLRALQLPRNRSKAGALLALGAFFVAAGANHFVQTDFYVSIMPPYLPAHLLLVYVSGVFEIVGGLGVVVPRVRVAAGVGLVLLLIAVFPANVHMALNPDLFPGIRPGVLLARLPLQALMIAWAYWATRPDAPAEPTHGS